MIWIFHLKFGHSEKATKIWNNHPLNLTVTKQTSNHVGNFVAFLENLNFTFLKVTVANLYWISFASLFSINNYFLFHTCLGGGTGFLILRKSAPEADRLCRCDLEEWLWPPGTPFPDSSDNESRLSVDWPLTIRLGPMRFSGEDSSAKLCRGGEVSELPPDFGPTVNKPIGLFPIC